MKYIKPVLRIILGFIYFVYGLNGFLHFLPRPAAPAAANAFFDAMIASGYFLPALKGTQLLFGLTLLSGFYVPLSLVVLAPVTLHIVLFHTFLAPAPADMILPLGMLVIHIALGWYHRSSYAELLRAK